jgi:hypothetical protein
MALLDELKKEVAKHNALDAKRMQVEALREKAQAVFKEQFLQDMSEERLAYLQGRLDALNECLQLFMSDEEKAKEQGQRKWEDDAV